MRQWGSWDVPVYRYVVWGSTSPESHLPRRKCVWFAMYHSAQPGADMFLDKQWGYTRRV